jgi:hypothetical protein
LRCVLKEPAQTAIGADLLCLNLDFDKRRLTLPSQKDVDSARNLGQAVVQEIAPVHWQLLSERFMAVKRQLTETDDLAGFNPHFGPDTLADTGPMVGYHEILPFAETMEVAAEGFTWLVNEQYCLHHDCTCHGSAITFIRFDERRKRRRPKQVAITVRYNYSTRIFARESPTSPWNPIHDILTAALSQKYPNLNLILKKQQHKLMRLLQKAKGQTVAEAMTETETEPPVYNAVAVPIPESSLSPQPSPRKPGRNEPCPCGSGKKYKKCCGRN